MDVGGTVTAKDIIIASGSVPFVPPGTELPGIDLALCHGGLQDGKKMKAGQWTRLQPQQHVSCSY